MAFQLPPLPSFNVQVPDLQQKAMEGAQLRNMMSEMALRQALAPSQVQQAQAQAQQAQQQAEMGKMQLQGQQALTDWIKNGDTNADISPDQFKLNDKIATLVGVDPKDPIMQVVRSMAQHGVPAPMLMAEAQQMLQRRTEYNKGTEEQQKIIKDNYDVFKDATAQIFNAPKDEWSPRVAAALPRLMQATHLSPELAQAVSMLQQDPQNAVPMVYNMVAAQDKALGLKKAAAEATEAEAKAAKEGAAAAVPTTAQQTTALSGINAYTQIPQNMRASLENEIRNAPNKEALDKIQARADTINESFQRSADARAQAAAMRDVGTKNLVAGRLLQMDQERDKALDQTAGLRGLLDMSKGGNETATAAAQTRFAEHEIVEGGTKRMTQLEYQNLASRLGSYGRQFTAWADKGFQGAMPAATNKEMQTILDAEDAAVNKAHERSISEVMERFGAREVRSNQPKTQSAPVQAPGAFSWDNMPKHSGQ